MPGFASGAAQGAQTGAMFGPWGAAIGAVAGGVLGSAEGDNGLRDRQQAQESIAQESLRMQHLLATHGVRWRVEDARAAGIHPAAALGMQPAQISGAQLNFSEGGSSNDWIGRAGHSISRAVEVTRTQDERDQTKVLATLAVERAGLENDLLRSRIAREQRDQVGPPMVDPANPGVRMFGTNDANRISEKPLERISSAPGAAHQEAGAVNDLGFSRTPTGWAIVPSKDFKDRGEDQLVPEVAWAIRNHLLPTISPKRYGYPPPETWLPEGATGWKFDRLKQEWQPEYPRRAVPHRTKITDGRQRQKDGMTSLFHGAP